MSGRKFNELKILVLEFLQNFSNITSNQIADALGLTLKNTQMLMCRLRKQQLVDKDELPRDGQTGRKKYLYIINTRGLARLEYFRDQAS